jgi:hypothetical protein
VLSADIVGNVTLEDETCGSGRTCSVHLLDTKPDEVALASSFPTIPNNISKKDIESASVMSEFACSGKLVSPELVSPRKGVYEDFELSFEQFTTCTVLDIPP